MRKKMHFEDFKNVVELRSAIECAAVNSAIKEASDAELRKLTVLVGEMDMEIINCFDNLPDELYFPLLCYAAEVGRKLIKIFKYNK